MKYLRHLFIVVSFRQLAYYKNIPKVAISEITHKGFLNSYAMVFLGFKLSFKHDISLLGARIGASTHILRSLGRSRIRPPHAGLELCDKSVDADLTYSILPLFKRIRP